MTGDRINFPSRAYAGSWILCAPGLVMVGVYMPHPSDQTVSFVLKNGVVVYGGFAGTVTLLCQRNIKANKTILSGDIGKAHEIGAGNTDICKSTPVNNSDQRQVTRPNHRKCDIGAYEVAGILAFLPITFRPSLTALSGLPALPCAFIQVTKAGLEVFNPGTLYSRNTAAACPKALRAGSRTPSPPFAFGSGRSLSRYAA